MCVVRRAAKGRTNDEAIPEQLDALVVGVAIEPELKSNGTVDEAHVYVEFIQRHHFFR